MTRETPEEIQRWDDAAVWSIMRRLNDKPGWRNWLLDQMDPVERDRVLAAERRHYWRIGQ
ncbi:hypothetical protein JQS43_21860 [Natronosporangium hydrolyticum]|uniref:Uncharacterized protein n=1 Tax=Natronosporangium hydrolyticum TaxID=2811111 RepID=A0A895YD91_9ACTN|nr:hypothetical protein [Natronosporangium hydrolyticum]QSB14142.1 hypothetical protein JQS43_21860 [Natronosporangium hydrolyticum]